uniref:Uncharacterized protein n=1 Tax=Lactuca sativa TaxID=4236 RepID=A0A9R1ULP1_LACSA|nr:hypothetical protein LSAT_V11C800426540 [Lactuca sativa]
MDLKGMWLTYKGKCATVGFGISQEFNWFGVDSFNAIYANNILPVNGRKLWIRTIYTKPLPPLARRIPWRPILKIKRHVTESQYKYSQNKMKVTGIGRTVQCKNCL